MRKSLIAFIFGVLLLGSGAYAVSVEAPATILVQQEQRSVPVTITNDSLVEQGFEARLSAPFDAVVSPSYGKVPAGKSVIAALLISPVEELQGSSFDCTLSVEMGEEKIVKGIRVQFKEELEESNGSVPLPAGLISFASFSEGFWDLFTLENSVNVVLALAAVILLIAFIARFVKRLEVTR